MSDDDDDDGSFTNKSNLAWIMTGFLFMAGWQQLLSSPAQCGEKGAKILINHDNSKQWPSHYILPKLTYFGKLRALLYANTFLRVLSLNVDNMVKEFALGSGKYAEKLYLCTHLSPKVGNDFWKIFREYL
uniref:Uncharacterized protein n=1 Tax=Glossina brevipalpis TaxID=37001 RepID=A0A1A9W0B9_9MUSC